MLLGTSTFVGQSLLGRWEVILNTLFRAEMLLGISSVVGQSLLGPLTIALLGHISFACSLKLCLAIKASLVVKASLLFESEKYW